MRGLHSAAVDFMALVRLLDDPEAVKQTLQQLSDADAQVAERERKLADEQAAAKAAMIDAVNSHAIADKRHEAADAREARLKDWEDKLDLAQRNFGVEAANKQQQIDADTKANSDGRAANVKWMRDLQNGQAALESLRSELEKREAILVDREAQVIQDRAALDQTKQRLNQALATA